MRRPGLRFRTCRLRWLPGLAASAAVVAACGGAPGADFQSHWSNSPDRVWPGPDYWSNPLQDWRVRHGRLENVASGGDRNIYLLTREVGLGRGTFETAVTLGRLEEDQDALEEGFVGFRVGIRGRFADYRDSALRGVGLDAGLTTDGRLFIGGLVGPVGRVPVPFTRLRLELRAQPSGSTYRVELSARSRGPHSGRDRARRRAG